MKELEKIVRMLFLGYIGLCAVIAFVPEITGISTAELTGMTKVAADICLWLIPLAAVALLIMAAVSVFSAGRYGPGRRTRSWGWQQNMRAHNAWQQAKWKAYVLRKYHRYNVPD